MLMDAGEIGRSELNEITERIIGCAFTVCNTLGSGFVEKVYEHALTHELRKTGLALEQQHPIQVLLLNFGKPRVEIKRIVHNF